MTDELTTAPTGDTPPSTTRPAFTVEQAHLIAGDLLERGVPVERVMEAALREDGHERPSPDTRTDEQREFDEFFGPVPSPDDYHVEYVGRIPAGVETPALAEFNAQATAWLAKIGFPANIGPAVVERALDVGQRWNRMSAPEQALWKAEQAANFERLAGGPEKAAARRGLAAKAMARAPRGFTEALRVSGALDDAGIIMHLANQEERLAARGS